MKGRFAAVLPAGGLGKRMGGNIPKQLMVLGGKPVYRYSLETFLSMDEIAEVVMKRKFSATRLATRICASLSAPR